MKKLTLLGVIILHAGAAVGQGMPPPAHPNSTYYVPPGAQSGNGVNQAPVIQWADRWGAVSKDMSGNFGIVTDLSNKSKAISAAISECRRRGGKNCVTVATYHNQCIAVVLTETHTYTHAAAYEDKAKELAMDRCTKNSGADSCWAYYSGCSLPVRVE